TKWDNSLITADNGGAVGAGPITFVHRSDGSGTNFLFTNAMANQCVGIFGPNNETPGAPLALYSFPWTDKTIGAAQCP
ncbi:substrate-binding domain-containing protein, partial [Acinetobacter baumannii]